MSKFASKTTKSAPRKHVIENDGTTTTFEGAPAFSRNAKSDLFLLGVANFVGEDTFYEGTTTRDGRFRDLVHQVTTEDPAWVAQFVAYLRGTANMRSASLVAAAEYVKAGGPEGRKVVASALQRADEPAEMLAYWIQTHGRAVPAAVKRGVADAAQRLYSERAFLKYDSSRSQFRFGDVIQLAHVKPLDDKQSALFKAALDDRYDNLSNVDTDVLSTIATYKSLHGNKEEGRKALLSDPTKFRAAGMTWESLSSFGPMDKEAWEAVIPSMGYMALLRNLRNFDEAGVSDEVAEAVARKLSDPEEVARSRQLIFRFYSAYTAAPSLRWGNALEKAMDLSVKNVPVLGGKTLVLVDTSASMTGGWGFSARSKASPVQVAALFGCALAKSGQNVDVKVFASTNAPFEFPKGGSVLRSAKTLVDEIGNVGHGTDIQGALNTYTNQDRVVVLTDMQTHGDYRVSRQNIPTHVPVYGFNLGGYGSTIIDTETNSYELGGLTDNTFSMITALEAGRNSNWPWETK